MGDTMIHPLTGEQLVRAVRPFVVEYKGLSRTVALPGWYPDGEGDGVVLGEDMASADRALAELKAEADGRRRPEEVRVAG